MLGLWVANASLSAAVAATSAAATSAAGTSPDTAPAALSIPPSFSVTGSASASFDLPAYWSPVSRERAPAATLGKPPAAISTPGFTIIALHGCGGLFDRRGRMQRREVAFIERANAAGHHVLLLDSFTPRGEREICTVASERRRIRPSDRRDDVFRAVRWLESQRPADNARYVILGWSNGGSSVLATADREAWPRNLTPPQALVAFYPGCRPYIGRWREPVAPLLLFLGDADNWTPADDCERFAQGLTPGAAPTAANTGRASVTVRRYPNANHGFDGPDGPIRERPELRAGSDGRPIRTGPEPAAREAAYRELFEWLANR